MADQDDRLVVVGEPARLEVDLGDERARRVDQREPAGLRVRVDLGDEPWADRTTTAPSGTSSSSSTKTAPLCLQIAHHVEVVDDLLADVDGPAVLLEGSLDGVDGAFDAGAVATWSCEQDRTHTPSYPCSAPSGVAGRPRTGLGVTGAPVAVCRPVGLGWSLSASDRVARSSCARRALPTFPGCDWRAPVRGSTVVSGRVDTGHTGEDETRR